MIKKYLFPLIKSFFQSKTFLYLVSLIYLIVVVFVVYAKNNDANIIAYLDYFLLRLEYLGFVFTVIGLFWIYDAKQSLEIFNRKHSFVDLTQLIDSILQKDELIGSDVVEDFITKVIIINSSDLPKISEIKENHDGNVLGNLGNISLEELQRSIIGEYFILKETASQVKISECKSFAFLLRLMRSFVRDQIIRN